jgi:hypothetical protein
MIQCDKCSYWQHTPCAGFCSNRDKKIPEGQYICDSCKFDQDVRMSFSLAKVAIYRRAIAVLYTEGISSKAWLAKRLSMHLLQLLISSLGCNFTKASNLIDKMESNGILIKSYSKGKQCNYSKKTGQDIKNKLKIYFGGKIEDIPEISKILKGDRGTNKLTPPHQPLLKKRKSLTRETVEACQS